MVSSVSSGSTANIGPSIKASRQAPRQESSPKDSSDAQTTDTRAKSAGAEVVVNQREAVKKLYEGSTDAPKAVDASETENSKAMVKRLYEETNLEETQAVTLAAAQAAQADSEHGSTVKEQQIVKDELKLLGAMAQDKAKAQEARLQTSREATRERVHLKTQRKFQEQFEAFSLAREMIALKDRHDDRLRGQMSANKAEARSARSDVQKAKARSSQSTQAFQARIRKQEAAVAKRLDVITPGSFEPPPQPDKNEQASVRISKSLQQDHQIEINPGKEIAQRARLDAEIQRQEDNKQFDSAFEAHSEADQAPMESVREALDGLKRRAEESGLMTLNSQSQAARTADAVLAETRERPEQAIQSQSQVSLQAALQVLR